MRTIRHCLNQLIREIKEREGYRWQLNWRSSARGGRSPLSPSGLDHRRCAYTTIGQRLRKDPDSIPRQSYLLDHSLPATKFLPSASR